MIDWLMIHQKKLSKMFPKLCGHQIQIKFTMHQIYSAKFGMIKNNNKNWVSQQPTNAFPYSKNNKIEWKYILNKCETNEESVINFQNKSI